MDAIRFDAIARHLNEHRSRRGLARLLGGITAGSVLGLAQLDATVAKKKKRPKCGPCRKTRKRGTCGKSRPDDTACTGNGRCLNGKCNPVPECVGASSACAVHGECCSEQCIFYPPLNDTRCFFSDEGQPCTTASDCESFNCVGYRCQPGESG